MKRFLIALVLTLGTGLVTFSALTDRAGIRAAAADANWPQWRGPGSAAGRDAQGRQARAQRQGQGNQGTFHLFSSTKTRDAAVPP